MFDGEAMGQDRILRRARRRCPSAAPRQEPHARDHPAQRRHRQRVDSSPAPRSRRVWKASPIPIYRARIPRPGGAKKIDPVEPRRLSDIDLLEELADLTGGKLYLGNRPEQTRKCNGCNPEGPPGAILDRVLLLQDKGAVKYRRISLKLAGRVRSVRVRAGYRGTEPPALSAYVAQKDQAQRKETKLMKIFRKS